MGHPNANVWVVIPTFNDSEPLHQVVAQVVSLGYSVAVVDDSSDVPVVLQSDKGQVFVLRHCANLGQGAALQTGIDFALAQDAKYLVTFDADGQHAAEEIERLLEPIRAGVAEIALGSRFAPGGQALNIDPRRLATLKLATWFTRVTTGLRITDTHNGFRAMSRTAALRIRITQNRMAHASQFLEEIARLSLPYTERPVTIRYTEYSVAKGQKLSNAFNILWESLTGRLS